jgi:hypothetical protein
VEAETVLFASLGNLFNSVKFGNNSFDLFAWGFPGGYWIVNSLFSFKGQKTAYLGAHLHGRAFFLALFL